VAESLAEQLRSEDIPNALIDVDALSIVHPHPGPSFSRSNLRAVWPNYAAIPGVKVLLPLVVKHADDLAELRDITGVERLLVCELQAPRSTLGARVAEREPNEFWKQRLMYWVDVYHQRDDLDAIRDFAISTSDRPVVECVEEIINLCGWRANDGAG
jgi:hypothetical protein